MAAVVVAVAVNVPDVAAAAAAAAAAGAGAGAGAHTSCQQKPSITADTAAACILDPTDSDIPPSTSVFVGPEFRV